VRIGWSASATSPSGAAHDAAPATLVREALLDLGNEGLVDVLRNRRFRVPNLTDADLDEIAQLRLMLEMPAHVSAAGKLTRESILECEAHVEQVAVSAQDGNLAASLD
jgi:DNA-binding GntR family transcriptional regulator